MDGVWTVETIGVLYFSIAVVSLSTSISLEPMMTS